MKTNAMLSRLRSCIAKYSLISDGDSVAVGLSGGKDSLAMLRLLAAYRGFSPEKFSLRAVTIDLGFEGTDRSGMAALSDFCQSLGVPHDIIPSDIGKIVFDIRKERNPCSLCAKLRRGAVNAAAKAAGANKVALAHHKDDLTETFMLSLLYEGRLSVFQPSTYLSRKDITVIRPMLHLSEAEISAYAASENLPVLHNVCPANHATAREEMKSLLRELDGRFPGAHGRIFGAVTTPERHNLMGFESWGESKDEEEAL